MNQELLLRVDERDVADQVVAKCPTFNAALKLSKEVSGLADKVFCQELDIDAGQWSRIWSGQAHFPENKLIAFLRLCNNLIALRWLSMQFNLGLHILKSELELENEQLRIEVTKKAAELETIKQFMREIKS